MKNKTRKYLFLATALLIFSDITVLAQSNKDYSQMPVLAKEARLKGDKTLADSIAQDYINNYLFKQKENVLFSKENLGFIYQYFGSTKSKEFMLFQHKREKINTVLGAEKVEYAVRSAIAAEYLPAEESTKKNEPDWDKLEKVVTNKFGSLGQEVVQGRRMMYYSRIKDWVNFGKYYVLYFKKALKRPEFIINQPSWDVFENVDDPEVVTFACDVVMKYAMEEWYSKEPYAYDTYANLLYKSGRVKEAIVWQEKAVKLAKGTPYENENNGHLEKMLKGVKTWQDTPKN
nr:hypothetical protein [Pedobacter sp. ASV19]